MKYYKLPEAARAGLIQYLASRPYAEVVEGIQMLTALEAVEEQQQP
jgi:hypothetical protein